MPSAEGFGATSRAEPEVLSAGLTVHQSAGMDPAGNGASLLNLHAPDRILGVADVPGETFTVETQPVGRGEDGCRPARLE
jgi:hypothetical protein